MLHEFVTVNTQEIIDRVRAAMAVRNNPLPTEKELANGVPLFLTQLIDRLSRATDASHAIKASAALYGGDLLAMGFTVGQVVRGYGEVCQVITALADEMDAPITVDEFRTFNCCLDEAIAAAVGEYERQRDESVAGEGTERGPQPRGAVIKTQPGDVLKITPNAPPTDLQDFLVPVNGGADGTQTQTESFDGSWFRSWGPLLANGSDDALSENEWRMEMGPQDEDEAPQGARATLFYVLRDGRVGLDWWWISVEVAPEP